MSNARFKCSFCRQHRQEAEAEGCPDSLETLPVSTRQRRNAVVAPMILESPRSVRQSRSPSWETVSHTTELSEPSSAGRSPDFRKGPYPTPSHSQKHPEDRRGTNNDSPDPPFHEPFTARSEVSPVREGYVRYSYNLFDNIEPTATPQQSPHNQQITPPPTAPRKRPNISIIEPMIISDTRFSAASSSTELENVVPSIEIPAPPNTPTHDNYNDKDRLISLRTSHEALTRQLQDSTVLVERLHTRASMADIERDRAVAECEGLRVKLASTTEEKGAARGWRRVGRIFCRALLVGVVLYAVHRFVLYQPEFEYILRRSEEILGSKFEG